MALELVRRQTADIDVANMYGDVKQQQAYMITCLCMLAIVTMIFRNRGFFTCTAVILYLAAMSSSSLFLKNVFVEQDFDFPIWITSMHFLCTAFCAFLILAYRSFRASAPMNRLQPGTLLRGVFPMAICFSVSLGLSNKGLSLSNVHFYEMVDTAAPLVTAFITVLLGTPFDNRLLMPLGVVTCALVSCWGGEAQFSWAAFACLLTGTILRACKGVLIQMYLTAFATSPTQVLEPIELVMYTSLMSFFFMSTWSFALDGSRPFHQVWLLDNYTARFAIGMSVVTAIVINFAAIFIIRDLGAVAQQLTGNLKGGLSVLGGVAVRGEVLTLRQAIGFSVLICGIAWYNNLDKKLKDGEQGKESEKLVKKGRASARKS